MSLVEGSSKAGLFLYLFNHISCTLQFRKYIRDEDRFFFFQKVQNLI